MTLAADIVIRPIQAEELEVCEELQMQVWGYNERFVVPWHLLLTAQKNGGILLGAFHARDGLVGFLFGFVGLRHGRPIHCSHMLGIRPGYRHLGIGYRLKCAQREHVLAQGLDLITWTYDPLEATNAHLNIAKLGAITRTYLRNIYGASPSHLHTGLETDRFLAEWWIRCPRVEQRLRERPTVSLPMGTVQVIRTAWEGGFARVIGVDSAASAPSIAVEIPADIQALKAVDLDAARAWRAATRTALEAYLARGYVVAEVVREREADGRQRVWYLLTREVEGWTDAD